MNTNEIAAFWNTPEAVERNRRDWILKQLEIKVIASHVKDGMRVLDVGCGDGETAMALIAEKQADVVAVDKSQRMLGSLRHVTMQAGAAVFGYGDVTDLQVCPLVTDNAPFDLIYTERCLINLPTWEAQSAAIRDLIGLLKPGGTLLLCEHSQDGLDEMNALRATLGLSAIVPPEHNRYLRDREIDSEFCVKGCLGACHPCSYIDNIADFAGTYYWLSRIVNAKLAKDAGREPAYDDPINKLALDLPMGPGPNGFRGQARLWVWRKS